MPYDVYARMDGGPDRLVVPAMTPIPEGAKPLDWSLFFTIEDVGSSWKRRISRKGWTVFSARPPFDKDAMEADLAVGD